MFKHYNLINHLIEQQIYLGTANQSDDVDVTVHHFNQIFVMFMALTLFGTLFEASFIFYYFSIIFEIYIDRQNFLFTLRRPSPKETNSIGYFKYFLEICPKFALITIAYYLSFYQFRLSLDLNILYVTFISIFVLGVLLYQMVYSVPPKGTERMTHLIERQKYISKASTQSPRLR